MPPAALDPAGAQTDSNREAPLLHPRTVLLIPSDHLGWPTFRAAVAELPALRYAGEATTADEALALARRLCPDLIFCADVVGQAPALPLLRALRALCPTAVIVVLAAGRESDLLAALLPERLSGYLCWNDLSSASLAHSVALLASGAVLLSSQAVAQTLHDAQPGRTAPAPVCLSAREQRVLAALAAGLTQEQIGGRERLSMSTMDRVLAALRRKLDAPSPFVLGMRAQQLGIRTGDSAAQPADQSPAWGKSVMSVAAMRQPGDGSPSSN